MAKAPYNPPQPYSPDKVYNTFEQENVDDEIKRINAFIRDKLNSGVEFDAVKTVVVIGDNGRTHKERDAVERAFEKAGWSEVTSTTSAENGERPGLIKYTLYR